MRTLLDLLDEVRADNDCIYRDSSFIPQPPEGLLLPKDVVLFYTHCGGL